MKLKALLLIPAFLLFSLAIIGQQTSDLMRYQHMEGSADSVRMKANLLRQHKQVSGNYEVSAAAETTTYEVYGKIDEENQAVLTPYGSNLPALKGIFFEDKFTGIWKNTNVEEDIELSESYPPGSIPLSVHYLHSEANLVEENPESPTAEIELTLLFPVTTTSAEAEAAQLMRETIAGHYAGLPDASHPDSVLVKAEQEFYKLYRESSEGWEETERAFSWTKEDNMSVIYNSNGILCLEYFNYVYTGGAHGMSGRFYDIFDLQSGKKLTFDQIFKQDTKLSLTSLINAQLRHDNGIPDSLPLTEAGFFIESIDPSENIYINGSGIGFIYSLYEIAPYSMGIITVFIPYKLLKDLLNPDCPVQMLAKNL